MKKTYDWAVRLRVIVTNIQRQLQIVASVHTNVHQLKIQIAKALKLPILDTRMQVYHRGGAPLKPLSTLFQNDIKTDACLTATIARTKLNEQLQLEKEEKGRGQVTGVGLSIVSSCTNPSCVNYNQKTQISYGLGVFPLLNLTSEAKCEVCPYKSQFLRPNMMCHEVKVARCFYKLEGIQLNSCGIPVEKSTGYLKCIKNKAIQELIGKNLWHSMTLHVKAL